MKTVEEIKEFARNLEFDIFGTVVDLLVYLPFEEAKEFLKPEVKPEEWKTKELTEEAIIKEMRDYMEFALGKADNHRGISSSRSIDHYRNWLFLLDDNELLEFLNNEENYENYGVPILKKICDKYNFPFPDDEGLLNMSKGKPCYSGCTSGCGRY